MNEKTKAALSIFAMSDDHGDYIVVSGSKCDTDTVKAKIMEATKDMESPPSMILSALSPGPGAEERVLKGIKHAFKGRKAPPVVGGSSADNDLSGRKSKSTARARARSRARAQPYHHAKVHAKESDLAVGPQV